VSEWESNAAVSFKLRLRMTSVETARLLLRLPEETDAGPLVIIHQDPEVLEKKQVTLTAPPGGLEGGVQNVRRMLRHWDQQGYGLIAPDNLRSIRVATKVGELFERADQDPVHGEPVHVYGIHRPG
jgi:RimJ/RimL family protein N-acetyltransferase